MSAPVLSETEITNRLLNYVTFNSTGPEAMFDHSPIDSASDKEGKRDHNQQEMASPSKETDRGTEVSCQSISIICFFEILCSAINYKSK